uniref:VQ domain-containing protein n=1 Tax=Leersia perrieri TaxID=77586 RepID=A0A0D9VUQ9_9ORYZ
MASSPPHAPPPSAKPPKKRPRASRRPPTTVLTTDTSNFRAMVQEFTGFPAPPFAAAPPPSVRPRLLAGGGLPPFLMRPSPLKYTHTHNPAPPLLAHHQASTSSFLGNAGAAATCTSSLVDALALFAKSNAMGAAPPPSSTAAASGSGGSDQPYHHHGHHVMMGGLFNPFDDYEAAAAADHGDKVVHGGGGHGGGFFSPLGAGDKYDDRH